ncbi:MAG: SAM-dependent methyltransferase [Treponema sp.]|nr:SAM-dependent methyltransferase [Treponema sp.]
MEEKAVEAALYLIPVTLGGSDVCRVLPGYNHDVVRSIRHFIVENVRSARRFLKLVDKAIDIDALTFRELNEHTDLSSITHYLDPLEKNGESIGIISEAGCPAVADPGAAVVELAQRKGLRVVPLVGPSSIIMAVMASGFSGQSFAFNGYLPVKDGERAAKLRKLEGRAWAEGQTQLFIEAPYRNMKMFSAILSACRGDTRLCVAAGLTTEQEWVRTKKVADWKKMSAPELEAALSKVPAIFLLYRG